jgi:hypothetical protein
MKLWIQMIGRGTRPSPETGKVENIKRPRLMFCSGIEHMNRCMEGLNSPDIPAAAVHSQIPPRDIPIIMRPSMVLALQVYRKTMTRRLAWHEALDRLSSNPWHEETFDKDCIREPSPLQEPSSPLRESSPWQEVKSGDRLWVRENLRRSVQGNWLYCADTASVFKPILKPRDDTSVLSRMIGWARRQERGRQDTSYFKGQFCGAGPLFCPAIHMPRWASRLTLTVTATRTEPLQNISEADAKAEGVDSAIVGVGREELRTYRSGFVRVWRHLYRPKSWLSNPEVCVISFTVDKKNIDAMPKTEAA